MQYDKFGIALEKAKKKIDEASLSIDDAQKRNSIWGPVICLESDLPKIWIKPNSGSRKPQLPAIKKQKICWET